MTPEKYFQFLLSNYTTEDGSKRQHAQTRYVRILEEIQRSYKPKFDISKCLAGTQPGFNGRVWFWSDLHFFHKNIIEFCKRPFPDVVQMNNGLLKNYLSRVSKEDIVLFGGDISFGKIEATNAILRSMKGYKINVLGNHDVDNKHAVPFQLAVDETVACFDFEHRGRKFFVSHYPIEESVLDKGWLNLHGHIHNSALHPDLGDGSQHVNMCVELTRFAPASLDELLMPGQLRG